MHRAKLHEIIKHGFAAIDKHVRNPEQLEHSADLPLGSWD